MLKSSDQLFELKEWTREHIKELMDGVKIQAFTFNVWTILPISLTRTH
jgi:hypothetical protein